MLTPQQTAIAGKRKTDHMEPIAPYRPGFPEPETPRPVEPEMPETDYLAPQEPSISGPFRAWTLRAARWAKAHMFLTILAAAAVLTVIIWAAVGFS